MKRQKFLKTLTAATAAGAVVDAGRTAPKKGSRVFIKDVWSLTA